MKTAALFLMMAVFPLTASAQTRVYALGGKSTTTWHGQADLQALNFELGHAFSPRTTVGVVAAAMSLWQPRSWFGDLYGDGNESVRAVSAAVLLRHSWREQRKIQPYVELTTGPMFAEKRVPAATSRFNFVSQIGGGVMLNGNGRVPVFAAYRVMHISNGGYAPRNPGLNLGAIVMGVQVRSARPHRR